MNREKIYDCTYSISDIQLSPEHATLRLHNQNLDKSLVPLTFERSKMNQEILQELRRGTDLEVTSNEQHPITTSEIISINSSGHVLYPISQK